MLYEVVEAVGRANLDSPPAENDGAVTRQSINRQEA